MLRSLNVKCFLVSADETHKMIVILLNALQESKEKLFNILVEGWPQNVEENTMKSKVQEIDFEDANAFLTRSVPTSIVQVSCSSGEGTENISEFFICWIISEEITRR